MPNTPPNHRARPLASSLEQVFRQLGAIASAALLVAVGARAYTLTRLDPLLMRYVDAEGELRAAHQAMLDQETGLRGYLLARSSAFLAPADAGRAALVGHNAALSNLVAGDADLAGALLEMRLSQQSWLSEWAPAAMQTAAVTPGFLERGKQLFDAYRVRVWRLDAQLRARVVATHQQEQRLLFIAGITELALFALTLWMLRLRHRQLGEAIVTPVGAILDAVGEVRAGREVSTIADGPSELREIHAAIAALGTTLREAHALGTAREAESADRARKLRSVLDMAREFAGSLNLRYVLRSVGEGARGVAGYDTTAIWLINDDSPHLVAAFHSRGPDGEPTGIAPIEVGQGLAGRAAKYGRPVLLGGELGPTADPDNRAVAGRALPLIIGARVVGVLELLSNVPHTPSEGTIEVLETLTSHAATAIEAARLHQTIERQSQQDALTQLLNRRRLEADLANECRRSARYARPFAVVMLDVDHFKRFNDTLGHPRGDTALQEFARILGAEIRSTDRAYRYGGEEFALLLPETTAESAAEIAERIRRRIENFFAQPAWPVALTASFGVAQFDPHEPPNAVIETADRRLYEAKRAGRNRVVGARAEGTPA